MGGVATVGLVRGVLHHTGVVEQLDLPGLMGGQVSGLCRHWPLAAGIRQAHSRHTWHPVRMYQYTWHPVRMYQYTWHPVRMYQYTWHPVRMYQYTRLHSCETYSD